jgi:aminoglycoside 6'-N-acetyltransferase
LTEPNSSLGCSVVVRRASRRGEHEYLVLHRAADPDHESGATSPAGARQPGEPTYPSALRVLHEQTGLLDADVWAVDLSGPWALFACEVADDAPVVLHEQQHDRFEWLPAAEVAHGHVAGLDAIPSVTVGLRPMTRADFGDVVRWQREPHVARWWSGEASDVAGAEAHYGPALDGTDPTRMWVVEVNGRSVGFVQDYRVGDHPEYSLLTGEPDAIGFDYAIGDPSWVGKGIGTRMLWTYLSDVVRPHYPEAATYYAAPDHRNAGSLRVLAKLGFSQGLWFDEPQGGDRVDTVVGCSLDVRRMFGDDAH